MRCLCRYLVPPTTQRISEERVRFLSRQPVHVGRDAAIDVDRWVRQGALLTLDGETHGPRRFARERVLRGIRRRDRRNEDPVGVRR